MTKRGSDQLSERFCIVRGCPGEPVCLDNANYTKYRDNLPFAAIDEALEREIWFCNEHAVQFLFPLIDAKYNNTTDALIADFKKEGLW